MFTNLHVNIANKIIAIPTLMEVDGLDTIGWGGISTHQFSVKSAYDLLVSNHVIAEGDGQVLWK